MKSKAPLLMMEQIIMVLVFALAAALCLQTFVLSGKISKMTEAKNRAVVEAQNAAEQIKARGLQQYLEEQQVEPILEGFRVCFDENWEKVQGEASAAFYLDICPLNHDNEYYRRQDIIIKQKDGTELIRIPVAGQTEVMQNE